MLPIDKFEKNTIEKIKKACGLLFSPEKADDLQFIGNLDLGVVKKAYREKVMESHPDLYQSEPQELQDEKVANFSRLQMSYRLMTKVFEKVNAQRRPKRTEPGRVIAIGGAKGGIGKSIFAVNLAVHLSAAGHRTVAADLDLGGANLHLYLGETILPKKVNDFLGGSARNIEEIMIENQYGPCLIGGDSSQLGAANISFARKMKLMRAIRNIDADYIIVDLGGDTSYNIIDFFLMADDGIVVTTQDPAAYLDAYRFIKVSLYRKLNRLYGIESEHRDRKDPELQELIHDATISENGAHVRNVGELLDRVKELMPLQFAFVHEAVNSFAPALVVNRVPKDADANRVVDHIRGVSQRMLSLDIRYLGKLSDSREIAASARELVPAVIRHPGGAFAKEIAFIADSLTKA